MVAHVAEAVAIVRLLSPFFRTSSAAVDAGSSLRLLWHTLSKNSGMSVDHTVCNVNRMIDCLISREIVALTLTRACGSINGRSNPVTNFYENTVESGRT